GTPTKGRWDGVNGDEHHRAQVEMPAAEKNIPASPIPPHGQRGTGLRPKDDGMGSMVMNTTALRSRCRQPKKISLQVLYPPMASEERDSDQRTMGWGQW